MRLFQCFTMVAQMVQRCGNLVAGNVDLPEIPGAFQQAHGLASGLGSVLADRLVRAGMTIDVDAAE